MSSPIKKVIRETTILKIITAASFAAIIAYNTIRASNISEILGAGASQSSVKGDRLPLGPVCTQPAWPHYGTKCVRAGKSKDQPAPVRQVRIVTIDRLSVAQAEDYCDCHR